MQPPLIYTYSICEHTCTITHIVMILVKYQNSPKLALAKFFKTYVYMYVHNYTFEVYTEIHPQFDGIDNSGLNGLSHYPEILQGHPLWTNHIVTLNQLLQ